MNTRTSSEGKMTSGLQRRGLVTAFIASAIALVLLVMFVRGVGAQAQQPLAPGAPAAGAFDLALWRGMDPLRLRW